MSVQIVAGSNEHELRFFVSEYLLSVSRRIREAKLIGSVLCAESGRRANTKKLNLGRPLNNRQQHAASEAAGTYEADTKPVAGNRFRASPRSFPILMLISIGIFE